MSLISILEKNIGWEETVLTQNLILRFLETGLPFQIEAEIGASGSLFCSLNFRKALFVKLQMRYHYTGFPYFVNEHNHDNLIKACPEAHLPGDDRFQQIDNTSHHNNEQVSIYHHHAIFTLPAVLLKSNLITVLTSGHHSAFMRAGPGRSMDSFLSL